MIVETFEGLAQSTHDVCIVGAGPVGISMAVELQRLGHSVLLLESGRNGPDQRIQQLSDAEFADPALHDDMAIAVSRQLGGTSNLWGGFCVEYDAIDFLPRPALVDARWPIAYEDLRPHYRRACEYTRSGDPVFVSAVDGVAARDPAFSFDTVERSAGTQQLQIIHRDTLHKSPQIDVRLGATVVGFDFGDDGRVVGLDVARSDGDEKVRIPVRTLVIAAGGLESTRLLLSAERRSPGRIAGANGPLGRYYMGHLIGDIADIEFAATGLENAFDYFVDGHGSYVRRRFVPSDKTQRDENILNCALWPIVPPVGDPGHGSAILSAIYLALAIDPLARLLVADAIRKRHIPAKANRIGAHIRNVLTGMPSAMAFSADFLWHRYVKPPRIPGFFVRNAARRYPLAYHSEQIPRPESRVFLSGQTDRTGLEKLHIDLRFHEIDARSIVKTHELLDEWLARTGFGRLHWRHKGDARIDAVLAQAQHGTHQIGTARMAATPTDGVVDANLRVFGTENLYVASTAVLPTSGQANPTLTAVALGIRLAAHLHAGAQSPAAVTAARRLEGVS